MGITCSTKTSCVFSIFSPSSVSYFSQKYSLLDTVFWKGSSTLLFPNLSQYNIFIHIQNQISKSLHLNMGFPGGSDCKESALQCRRSEFNPWVRRSPGEGNDYPLLLGFHGRRAWKGFSPWGYKESDVTEWLTFTFHVSVFLDTYSEMPNVMCCKLILS